MRRTDFCRLILSYQHPRSAGSRLRPNACAPGASWGMPDSTSVPFRFGDPHPCTFVALTRALSSRRGACGPTSDTLSPPPPCPCRSRVTCRAEAAEAASILARVNGARSHDDHECLPSCECRHPATPSRASGSGLPRPLQLGRRRGGSRRLCFRRVSLRSPAGAWPPSTRPVATGNRASLSLDAVRRLLQPIRCAGTPVEPSILAREWDFRPAARRHQPMPVASASPERCRTGGLASRNLHEPACAQLVPLAWTTQITGRNARARRGARS
jgi:hypothetical protein